MERKKIVHCYVGTCTVYTNSLYRSKIKKKKIKSKTVLFLNIFFHAFTETYFYDTKGNCVLRRTEYLERTRIIITTLRNFWLHKSFNSDVMPVL